MPRPAVHFEDTPMLARLLCEGCAAYDDTGEVIERERAEARRLALRHVRETGHTVICGEYRTRTYGVA